jgi:hypothetical protein
MFLEITLGKRYELTDITLVSIKGLYHRHYIVIFVDNNLRLHSQEFKGLLLWLYHWLYLWLCVPIVWFWSSHNMWTLVFLFGEMRTITTLQDCEFYGIYTLSSLEYMPTRSCHIANPQIFVEQKFKSVLLSIK